MNSSARRRQRTHKRNYDNEPQSNNLTTLTDKALSLNTLIKKQVLNNFKGNSKFPISPDWRLLAYLNHKAKVTLDNIIQVFYELYLDLKAGKLPWLQFIYCMGARQSGKTHIINWFIRACFMTLPNTICYVCRRKYTQSIQTKKQFLSELANDRFPVIEKVTARSTPQELIENTFLKNTAPWKNQIIFKTLNPEKTDLENGGGTGETTWAGAKLIILFFEEASTHDEGLIRQFKQSVRGDKDTKILEIYASNPWSPMNWYVKDFNSMLEPSEDMMEQVGYQLDFVHRYKTIDNQQIFLGCAFVWRSAVWLNTHLSKRTVNELKALKEISPTQYKIAYLGIDGIAEGGLYTAALEKMKAIEDFVYQDDYFNEWEVVAGLDWGDGVSQDASPTTIHLGLVNAKEGLRVLKEFTYYNNQLGQSKRQHEIMSLCIKWLKQQWEWLNTFRKSNSNKIKCFVDDAASSDFVQTFNNLLEPNDANKLMMEFFPAYKFDIQERVEVTNWMLGYGQLRIDTKECPSLYGALMNCRRYLPRNGIIDETTPFKRDHKWTHWINSGVEYIISEYFYKFREPSAVMFGWDQIDGPSNSQARTEQWKAYI